MKANIIDPDYIHWEETRKYDEIIAECMRYVYNFASVNDGIIVLEIDDIYSTDSKFLFKIARLCNTTANIPIYISLGFWDYHKFLKMNKTEYKTKRNKEKKKIIEISVNTLKDCVKLAMPKIYSDDLFEKIYNEYWLKDEEDNYDDEEIEFDDDI